MASSGGDLEGLELARARVGRPAQDVGEAVRPVEQGRDRLLAEVRVDRDRVRAEDVEQGDRLAGGGGPDVATLGVGHERDVGRDERPQPLERRDPVRRRTPRRTRGWA